MALLIQGLRGKAVELLQTKLGIDADGVFGVGTERAVKAFQEANGLSADGKAGLATFMAMELFDLVLLRRGSKGTLVKSLQLALGVGDDGIFGLGTERVLRTYQENNGLDVDGLAGPNSLRARGDIKEQILGSRRSVGKARKRALGWPSNRMNNEERSAK